MTNQQQQFMTQVLPGLVANGNIVSRKTMLAACNAAGIKWIPLVAMKESAGRGMFDLTHLTLGQTIAAAPFVPKVDNRTDEEVEKDINDRFESLDRMAFGIVKGSFRSMIVAGNPGIGKTYTLETILEGAAHDGAINFTPVRGYVKPTGLYRLLYECREKNSVLLLDDADSIWQDEVGLNMLKGALDTTRRRTVSWRSEKQFETDDGEKLPNQFDFKGAVVFVTNLNFDFEIMRSNRLTPHLQALISRSFYLDLNLPTQRDLMLRIKSVIKNTEILADVNATGQKIIARFMDDNVRILRELSLRMALKLGQLYNSSKTVEDFNRMAMSTCTKRS